MAEQAKYLKNLKSESVVQQVINCLTDGMVSGELKPGDRLPSEPELAAQLGVARTSVREATKILAYLGVLESRRFRGHIRCQRIPGEHDRPDGLRRHTQRRPGF